MLTEEQQRFLLRYINNKGDFYKTVDSMGLDSAHIFNWRKVNSEFEEQYQSTKQQVIAHLKEENYMTALLKVNDALMNGITQHTVTQRHIIDADGSSGYEVTRTTKNLGVPGFAIKQALEESSIVKAVSTLVNEGVLPSGIAQKILNSANKISEEVTKAFGVSSDSDYLTDKKAIALIKSAILGGDD